MRKISVIAAILSAVVLAGVFPVAFASHSTPLKGSMAGSGVATSQTTNSLTATGHLSHLGRLTLVGTTSVTGASDCGGFVGTEQDTITSQNGDKIFVSGNGVSCPISTSPLMFQDTVTFSVTGGTGRFANASGSGAVHTTIVIISQTGDSTFTATIDGTITF